MSTASKPTIGCGELKLSKRGVWRAGVLLVVQLLMVAHYMQWRATGRTLSPVEPSEAMKTLELGYLNAGFIFFGILILSTLIFGRFFCGWGCHVVAYQDLCGWLMKKVGIKPKPFRSRLLIWVPTFAAFYMFVWPQFLRIWAGGKFPPITYHFTTEGFWDTFPTFWIAILTFAVCGFLIVYLLGNKGFCSYGCPYGAIFAKSDLVAPGRILVTDACEQCGHCTATCTSNVRVHEEVKKYGMVVDVGCMKCMDCVSVCPKNALYFGFSKPALRKKLGVSPVLAAARGAQTDTGHVSGLIQVTRKNYDFSVLEDIVMALLFVLGFYAFRGLYEGIPFLLSLGLSSITAYLLLQGARVFYAPQVRLQRWQLRSRGAATTAGYAFAASSFVIFLFMLHSAVWQYKWREGNRLYTQAVELSQKGSQTAANDAAKAALENFQWSYDNGLFEVSDLDAKLGTAYSFLGQTDKALPLLKRAVELNPKAASVQYQFAKILAVAGNPDEALRQLKTAVQNDPSLPGAKRDLANALASAGQTQDALLMFGDVLKRDPADLDARLTYGMLLAQAGRLEEGERELRRVAKEKPSSAVAHYNLALVFAERGRKQDAEFELNAAVQRDNKFVLAFLALGRLAAERNDYATAQKNYAKAFTIDPFNRDSLIEWASTLRRQGMLNRALQENIRRPSDDVAAWYRAAILYSVKADSETADSIYQRLRLRNPNLTPP